MAGQLDSWSTKKSMDDAEGQFSLHAAEHGWGRPIFLEVPLAHSVWELNSIRRGKSDAQGLFCGGMHKCIL